MRGVKQLLGGWRAAWALALAKPSITFGYAALAVLLPFLLFSVFPQASMRSFVVLAVDSTARVSRETPVTIVSMFLIAGTMMLAMMFACWNALLNDNRDGWAGEIIYGAVTALLTVLLLLGGLLLVGVVLTPILNWLPKGLTVLGLSAAAAGLIIQMIATASVTWLHGRLLATGPAVAATGSINPAHGIGQSWRLTRPVHWSAFALILVVELLWGTLFTATIIGTTWLVYAGGPDSWHDSIVSLIWVLFNLTSFLIFMTLTLGAFLALREPDRADVFE